MIKAVLYIEVGAEIAMNQQTVAVCTRAAELEAEAHGYKLTSPMQITHSETDGTKRVLFWDIIQA